jgi:hypothetical protein
MTLALQALQAERKKTAGVTWFALPWAEPDEKEERRDHCPTVEQQARQRRESPGWSGLPLTLPAPRAIPMAEERRAWPEWARRDCGV